MTEKRVKDVFPMNNGLMYAISVSGSYQLGNDIDLRLLANCGKRCITPIVELLLDNAATLSDEAIQRLSNLILSEYKDSWDKIYSTLTLEYNPLSASQYNETETQNIEGETSDESTQVKQDDVSTSDSLPDNFISDGKSTNDSNSTSTNRNTSTRTLTRTSNSTSYKPVDLLKSEIDMRIQTRFTAQILEDVKNYIAMPIY